MHIIAGVQVKDISINIECVINNRKVLWILLQQLLTAFHLLVIFKYPPI